MYQYDGMDNMSRYGSRLQAMANGFDSTRDTQTAMARTRIVSSSGHRFQTFGQKSMRPRRLPKMPGSRPDPYGLSSLGDIFLDLEAPYDIQAARTWPRTLLITLYLAILWRGVFLGVWKLILSIVHVLLVSGDCCAGSARRGQD